MNSEKNTKNQKIIDSYDYLANAASPMDCTGLIPSKPVSKAEIESYEDIYRFLPPPVTSDTASGEEHSRNDSSASAAYDRSAHNKKLR